MRPASVAGHDPPSSPGWRLPQRRSGYKNVYSVCIMLWMTSPVAPGATVSPVGSKDAPLFSIQEVSRRTGVPKITLLRMAFNIGLDYVVGMVPFIGDAFDFVWKANQQNMDLIRTRAAGKGKGKTSDYIFVFGLIGLLIAVLVGSIVASAFVLWWVLTSRPFI